MERIDLSLEFASAKDALAASLAARSASLASSLAVGVVSSAEKTSATRDDAAYDMAVRQRLYPSRVPRAASATGARYDRVWGKNVEAVKAAAVVAVGASQFCGRNSFKASVHVGFLVVLFAEDSGSESAGVLVEPGYVCWVDELAVVSSKVMVSSSSCGGWHARCSKSGVWTVE